MIIPLDGFKFVKGELKTFKRDNITNSMIRLFCKTSGTAIGTKNPNRPNLIILKVGTFDNPLIFRPEIAIFTCDKQNFHYVSKNVKAFIKNLNITFLKEHYLLNKLKNWHQDKIFKFQNLLNLSNYQILWIIFFEGLFIGMLIFYLIFC